MPYTVSATLNIRLRKTDVPGEDADAALRCAREWISAAHLTVADLLREAGFSVETHVDYLVTFESTPVDK